MRTGCSNRAVNVAFGIFDLSPNANIPKGGIRSDEDQNDNSDNADGNGSGLMLADLSETPLVVMPASIDRELDAAMKFIEKAPESAAGYNQLATVYIKRARETGDFSLNNKAKVRCGKLLRSHRTTINSEASGVASLTSIALP
jgi:hypothetical protein